MGLTSQAALLAAEIIIHAPCPKAAVGCILLFLGDVFKSRGEHTFISVLPHSCSRDPCEEAFCSSGYYSSAFRVAQGPLGTAGRELTD